MRKIGHVEKGWGYENIFVTDDDYCGKILHFRKGKKSSMHFHLKKKETWYCLSGEFFIHLIDPDTADIKSISFSKGDVYTNLPGYSHQVECLFEGDILEVSTPDSVEDNYRVSRGDSQK